MHDKLHLFQERVNFATKHSKMENKELAALKEAMMQGFSEEIDKWLDKQSTLTSGYDYETEFMKTARTINQMILEKSLGTRPVSRNCKRKFTPALGK